MDALAAKLHAQMIKFKDIKYQYKQGIPYDCIIRDNYRKTMDEDALMELGQNIEEFGLLQAPCLIDLEDGTYLLCYGERRIIACEQYTDFTVLPEAKVYPLSAKRFHKTIQIIENVERADVALKEEITGFIEAINSEYKDHESPQAAFCEIIGINPTVLSKKLKIGEIMATHSNFHTLVESQKIKDYATLYDIAQAIMAASTEKRKAHADKLINMLLSDDLKINVRTAAKQAKDFAKKGGRQPVLESQSESTATNQTAKPKDKKIIPPSASQFKTLNGKILATKDTKLSEETNAQALELYKTLKMVIDFEKGTHDL